VNAKKAGPYYQLRKKNRVKTDIGDARNGSLKKAKQQLRFFLPRKGNTSRKRVQAGPRISEMAPFFYICNPGGPI
jgi:hypothetical protein